MSGNVTVSGRRTSVRLEPQMWSALEEICARERTTLHALVTEIDRGRTASSLTAAIRVYIVNYFRAAATDEGHRMAGHVIARPPAPAAAIELDGGEWHSRIQRIYRYWRSISPPGRLPGLQHFDPLSLPADLLPNLWVLEIQREPLRAKFRLLGSGMVRMLGRDLTGHWLDDAGIYNTEKYAAAMGMVRRLVEERRPVWHKGPTRLSGIQSHRVAEFIRLPLARDGVTVDAVLNFAVLYGGAAPRQAGSETKEGRDTPDQASIALLIKAALARRPSPRA